MMAVASNDQRPLAPSPTSPTSDSDGLTADSSSRKIATGILVSLKSRNEALIELGKRHGDLHYRLQNDIDRARSAFIRDVGSPNEDQLAEFDDELIRIIAEGDRTLLRM
jgi:hypothetical protein